MKLSIVHTGKPHPDGSPDKWSCIKIEGMYCIDIIFPSVASKEDIESITRLLGASSDLLQALQKANEFISKTAMYSEDSVPPIELVKQIDSAIQKATL